MHAHSALPLLSRPDFSLSLPLPVRAVGGGERPLFRRRPHFGLARGAANSSPCSFRRERRANLLRRLLCGGKLNGKQLRASAAGSFSRRRRRRRRARERRPFLSRGAIVRHSLGRPSNMTRRRGTLASAMAVSFWLAASLAPTIVLPADAPDGT